MKRISACLVVAALAGCRAQETAPAAASTSAVSPTTTPVATDAAVVATTPSAAAPAAVTSNFDADKPGNSPAGFSFARTGSGHEGKWRVKAEPGAPSGGNVLAQLDADSTDMRFPVAIADAPVARDVDVRVRCKPVSGQVDQACGLVLRYRDANNYYVTRANALEGNTRLYFVKDGQRQQIASWSGKVTSGAWHDLRFVANGNHFEVHWDGAKILDHTDETFKDAGKSGVWTKADSVTYFDDLQVTPLD